MNSATTQKMPAIRWLYAVVGLIVLLFAGFVYGWSVFAAPIGATFPEWTSGQLSLTFTICMAFFCLGGFFAGNLSKKIGARANVILSGVLFLVGFFLVSRVESLAMLYISYGVICGLASGFAYNSVMSTITKWFPNAQGTISGVLLMSFGFSSMILGSVFTALTAEMVTWRQFFLVMGVVIAIVMVVGSFFFKLPPAGLMPAAKAKESEGGDFTPAQMVTKSSFWLFFVWAILVSGVGLAVIARAKPFADSIGVGLDAGTITFVVGLISICNGIGRVIFGGLFDKIGWRLTMCLVNAVSLLGVLILLAAFFTNTFVLVVVGFIVTGLAYGGAPTMGSAFIGKFFGQKNYAVNFSIGNMNLLVASFAGTLAGVLYDASQTYLSTLIAIGVASIVAFIALSLIRPPKKA